MDHVIPSASRGAVGMEQQGELKQNARGRSGEMGLGAQSWAGVFEMLVTSFLNLIISFDEKPKFAMLREIYLRF